MAKLAEDFKPESYEELTIQIPRKGLDGKPENEGTLLGCLAVHMLKETNYAGKCVLYLHGFPDQSLEHRKGHERFGKFSTRIPQKL